MSNPAYFETIVGNVGCVYHGTNHFDALAEFNRYASMSRKGYGRVAGEDVALFKDGNLIKEYVGQYAREIPVD